MPAAGELRCVDAAIESVLEDIDSAFILKEEHRTRSLHGFVPVTPEAEAPLRQGCLAVLQPPKPWNPADQRDGQRRHIPSEPVVFLGSASYEDQPQVDISFGAASYENQLQVDITFGAPSYEDQPQVDITLGAPSIQMIETTEDEAPAASEEAVRKEQVRPEESVSCVTENVQAFMTDLSHEELDGEESLQEVVELVFKRAVQKSHSAAVFAELCQHLSTVEVQSFTDLSASVSFRSLLVKHCQAEFRKNCDSEGNYQKSGFCLEPVRDVRVIGQLREEQKNAKPSDQFLNTLRFIGELFLSKLIQQDLEVVTSKEVMDTYYNQLDFIAEKGKRAPRLSLLLKDTVDLRK
ncbi:unnamed protein product [Pleuronectes platessa]|uniref:MIF4G domain-containing protein n=1 Tax=Pleuronectes platessa TaxID=8262 RepID=A0A9N7VR11_PLEPL|nr:unnamed protein product [Pleuronectes platessa]